VHCTLANVYDHIKQAKISLRAAVLTNRSISASVLASVRSVDLVASQDIQGVSPPLKL